MKRFDKQELLLKGFESFELILDILNNKADMPLDELNPETTAVIVIDMINGFAKKGALSSKRIKNLIPEIVQIIHLSNEKKIPVVAFADNHSEDSPEFLSYPHHCTAGSWESEIVDEIKEAGSYFLIQKNSTNGFLEKAFQSWLNENSQIENFVIIGDCTDICIQQFSVTLKACFNMKNRLSKVIVPMNAVDTYDSEAHNAELMNITALYNMMINGVEIVNSIK